MYKVRNAELSDLSLLLEKAPKFFDFLRTKYNLFNWQQMARMFLSHIESGILLLAEKDGQLVGGFGATIGGHPYNPDILSAFETFWWIEEEHRNSKAGLLLFNEYIKLAKEKACKMIHISKLEHSPFKETFLEKKGFSLVEKAYLMEV